MGKWNEPENIQVLSDSEKHKEFYLVEDGLRIHAKLDFPEEAAEKYPLVIIIHGYTGHMEETHITAVAAAVNESGFAALRVEMYGHGHSDGLFKDHTLYKWVTQALAVVDYARGLDFVTDLILCGHSQGGLTVILTAALKRDVLKALIPLAPAVMIPEYARQGNQFEVKFDPENVPDTLHVMNHEDPAELNGNYIRVAQSIFVDKAISKYQGPVLIIHGDEDETVPVKYGIDTAKSYANAKLVLIHGDDHCYHYHLDQVTEAIKEFLVTVSGQRNVL
ncbi:MAG: alpha/beta fold hydrolase [Blautia sp.]|nr:alpha/beta fold hydrolase [Blautia sp.]